MADRPVKYQHKTVQAVRGTESLSINKWQKQGWELIDQTPGKLRITLRFRKPVSYRQWILLGVMLAFLLFALGAVSLIGAFQGEDERVTASDKTSATPTPSPLPTASVSASETPSAMPTPTPKETLEATPTPTEDPNAIITAETDEKFARLLKGNECNYGLANFARKNEGRLIEFAGGVAGVASRGGGTYDVLITPGDKGPNATVGPYFQFEKVSIADLNFDGPAPDRLEPGDLLRLIAAIDKYNSTSCQFFLQPSETAVRS